MEKQQNQIRLIELFKYLWNNTDREHYATIVDMQNHLKTLGFNPDRKTLVKDIEMLNSIGFFDIRHDRSTQNRYYVTRRIFQEADVRMLSDAVRSAYFISPETAEEFITMLETFVGPGAKEDLRSPAFTDAGVKTKNSNVIKNAEKIAKAISGRKKIAFKYFDYNVDRKKEHKGKKKYVISPYVMRIDDGKYYFAGFEEESGIVKTFRIDKVDYLTVTEADAVPQPKAFNVKHFASQTRMYPGYECTVELCCHKEAMFGIIDKFGKKAKTEKVDDDHFTATVKTDVSPTFFGWVLGFGGKIKIIAPAHVVEDFKTTAHSVFEKTGKSTEAEYVNSFEAVLPFE